MRRIPVDTTRVRFVGTGKSAARAQYAVLAMAAASGSPTSRR
jgi:hypothetical protein